MLYPQNGDRFVTVDSVTSLHPIGLYIMAVADVLETRISTRARKGQESENYLKGMMLSAK